MFSFVDDSNCFSFLSQWTFNPFIFHSKRFYTVLLWCRVLAFLVVSVDFLTFPLLVVSFCSTCVAVNVQAVTPVKLILFLLLVWALSYYIQYIKLFFIRMISRVNAVKRLDTLTCRMHESWMFCLLKILMWFS